MRYFKRLVAMMMVMVMALACTATAFAAEADKAEGTVHELYYTTYNEKGEIVERLLCKDVDNTMGGIPVFVSRALRLFMLPMTLN